jgi:hypothetical protein
MTTMKKLIIPAVCILFSCQDKELEKIREAHERLAEESERMVKRYSDLSSPLQRKDTIVLNTGDTIFIRDDTCYNVTTSGIVKEIRSGY